MSANTAISWATKTWNPTVGCEHVSSGCDNCYAKTLHDMRHAAFKRGKLQNIPQYAQPFETVQTIPDRLMDPLSWRAPERVFVNSVSDVFHKDVPVQFIDAIMGTIAIARRHTFMILTKRPARMRAYSQLMARRALRGFAWPLPNLIFGVSAENQATADQRIPMLLETPAAMRFVSCEPLLGAVDISLYLEEEGYLDDKYVPPLDWVIAGGESGKNARPMHPEWARSLRDQCVTNGVAFHFKQWGEYREYEPGHVPAGETELVYTGTVTADVHAARACNPIWIDPSGRTFTDPDSLPGETPCRLMERVGTARAGRTLDGRSWDEFPTTTVHS